MSGPSECNRCGDELYDYEAEYCGDCWNEYYAEDDESDDDDEL